jgi:membrane protease YdiL (CAAX protease family)
VVVLVFAAMPMINWTGELNSHLTLPNFMSGLENWMKSSEESAKKITDAFLQMNNLTDLFVNLIIVALLAAVGEELLFRGAMQNIILEWTKNKHTAVWITAILFSALHAQFYGFLPRMLLGVVLGYLYIWSGSLWLSMLFHFLNNGLAVLFSFLIGKGTISETAETVGAGDTPIYFVAMSVVVSAGLMYVIYKNREEVQALNP